MKNYLAALSFANLVYLRAWADLLPASPDNQFLRKELSGFPLFGAIACDVLALSLLVYGLMWVASKLPELVQALLRVVAVGVVFLGTRSLATSESVRNGLVVNAMAVVLVLGAVAALWFRRQAAQLIRGAAMAATPCLAVTFIGLPIMLAGQKPLPPDPPLAARLSGSPTVRVIWILFDDWDERLTFHDRAVGMRLPALDNLSIRSFRATRALAVEAGQRALQDMATQEAVPSLLYGKFLVQEEAEDAKTQRLEFVPPRSPIGAEDNEVLGDAGNVFERGRARGWNSAVAGWYLPYCRVFGSQLTDCYWDIRYIPAYAASRSFREGAIDETRMLFETTVFSPFGAALVDAKHFAEYQAILTAGKRYAADASIGLAFIHFNVPHGPYFYDPKIGPSLRYGFQGALYAEALRYVDGAIGEILAAVHAAGLDSKTAYLVSSDHPFRYSGSGDTHVPFLVHLPGDETNVVLEQEFSAILTKDLILAIEGGEVKSSTDVVEFVRNYRK